MNDPLNPSAALLCKLGSLIVHAEEFISEGGHPYDLQVFLDGLRDSEVVEWLNQMSKMAMLPVKR